VISGCEHHPGDGDNGSFLTSALGDPLLFDAVAQRPRVWIQKPTAGFKHLKRFGHWVCRFFVIFATIMEVT